MSKFNFFKIIKTLCCAFCILVSALPVLADEQINFSTHGAPAYYVGEQINPELILKRGVTYQIQINATGHPLWIKTEQGPGVDNAYNKGVTGNGTDRGTITFIVPTDAPDQLVYNCQYHVVMHGLIKIIN